MLNYSDRIIDKEAQQRWVDTTGTGSSLPDIGSLVVPIAGAFPLAFSQGCSRTAWAYGMSVDICVPHRYGWTGGVIDRQDVQALRDFLTQWLDGSLPQIEG